MTRKYLEDLFANLPALLVVHLSVTAEVAEEMANTCVIEEENEKVWVYTHANLNILSCYRLGFDGKRANELEVIQKLTRVPNSISSFQWENAA